jgi:hypothetical protein
MDDKNMFKHVQTSSDLFVKASGSCFNATNKINVYSNTRNTKSVKFEILARNKCKLAKGMP